MNPLLPRSLQRSLSPLLSIALVGSVCAQTTFSFHFNNNTGITRNSALHSWTSTVGATGVNVTDINVSDGSGISNGAALPEIPGESSLSGFAFYVPATGVAPGAVLLRSNNTNATSLFQGNQDTWFRNGTAALTGRTVSEITQLSVYTRAANTGTVMRFAIQTGGVWYASATSFTQTDVNVWEQRTVVPSAINWLADIGTPGTSLDTDLGDNVSSALDPGAVITAYGLYADTDALTGTDARLRIDSYGVATSASGPPPVPTTIVVSPASASVNPYASQQFSAVLNDQYGLPIAPQPSFGWSLDGGGSISSNGLFSAGGTSGSFTVTASAASISANASVTVLTLTGSTTFSSFFNNGTLGSSGDKSASQYNWAAAVGTAGTIVDSPSTVAGVSQGITTGVPLVSGASTNYGFLFHVPGTGQTPVARMLYRTSLGTNDSIQDAPQGDWHRAGNATLGGLTLAGIHQLSVYTRPAFNGTVMRFAIRVGSTWYASATSFTQTDINVWEQKTIDPKVSQWISGVGTPGSSLDTDLGDNPSGPLALSSVITGYGLYAHTGTASGTGARLRIDSYQVTTINFGSPAAPYDDWADTFPGFTDTDRALDPDDDGLENLLEFVLGGDPRVSQTGVRPVVTDASANNLVIRFLRSDESELQPVAVKVQISGDLVTWNPADDIIIGPGNGNGPNGATYTIAENGSAPDLVTVTIPKAAAARKFARVLASE